MMHLLGDYQQFFAMQNERLSQRSIDISSYAVGHLAFRAETIDEYLDLRKGIEQHCIANVENVWNGRPISKLLLKSPLDLGYGFKVSLIELIPPVHQSEYKMGLEHVGIVIGEDMMDFCQIHQSHFIGQLSEGSECESCHLQFEDRTKVKFSRASLMALCTKDGYVFDAISHVGPDP